MKSTTQTFWWRTKAFKVGLGVFVVFALVVVFFFGDQVGRLLDLFGSRAGTERVLTVDDNPSQVDGHGYLGAGDLTDDEILYIAPTDTEAGYVTLQ
ncbi:MAG: hypothetical protein PHR51_01055 [Patescibacteria group bacterium]|nr:hypothetical protein [Patescibacteria group bacterium]